LAVPPVVIFSTALASPPQPENIFFQEKLPSSLFRDHCRA